MNCTVGKAYKHEREIFMFNIMERVVIFAIFHLLRSYYNASKANNSLWDDFIQKCPFIINIQNM